MEKGTASSLFVNDGSFMERFKQLQQENGAAQKESKPGQTVSENSTPKPITSKTSLESKVNVSCKFTPIASSGKLAFSLKQKSKLVAPSVKLSEDEGEEENDAGSDSGPQKRQKLGQLYPSDQSSKQVDVAPPSPTDPTVKKVADKLASFVAKNGRQFEHITRQKNPGDTPFQFLFDESCADYKYYEHRLSEEKKALSQNKDSQTSQSGVTSTVASSSASMSQRSYQEHSRYQAPSSASGSQRSRQQHSSYQTPASALYESGEDIMSVQTASSADADPIARMEFYMKKAAQEERKRQPKQSKDEMPPPASLQGPAKKGHHMGDYIPPDELAKFLASCNDVVAQKAAKEAAERSKIQSDNVGHKLLSKMGWKEGEGLGSSRSGIADPIRAGDVKRDHLGVGAHQPGEVTADDDIYEQYKKRMMLGYKYRPNPLNNPRKAYY